MEDLPAPIIELAGITKRYPGVIANRGVDLSVAEAEVHAIVGENGAGKSTLMKILYGMVVPDEGAISMAGEEVSFASPADAIAAGIGMVHQHFKLADNLTVHENIILGAETTRRGGWLDLGASRRRLAELVERHALDIPIDHEVRRLAVGQRQRVEIAKALYRGARILIMDEPTAVLVPQEVNQLLDNLRELVDGGLTVLFISHKLDEVMRVSDRITVMRQGTTVATLAPSATSPSDLARLMVGSELPEPTRHAEPPRERVVLAVRSVDLPAAGEHGPLEDVSLEVHEGEILGVAGVEGNGQAELLDVVLGLLQPVRGRIELDGVDVTDLGAGARRQGGLAYIPQDRQLEGLLMNAPLWENRILGQQMHAPVAKGIWIDRRAAKEDTERIVAESDVRTPSIHVLASALSGGNQQKLIVGRELSGAPRLLLAAHPTRGVDVGAQAAIWRRLADARAAGLAVLLVSADLEELIGLSDRIVVLLRGRVVSEVDPTSLTPEVLGAAMTGVAA
jgi:general nucleoside transport system ATP-binding protein